MQTDNGSMKELTKQDVVRETQKGNADLIFTVGERVKIKGGDFVIESFGKKALVLRGLPGTRLRT